VGFQCTQLKATEPSSKTDIFDAPNRPMTAEKVIVPEQSLGKTEKLQQSNVARENLQSLPNEALVETGLENLLYPGKIDLLPQPRPCDRFQSQEVVAEAKSCSYTHLCSQGDLPDYM
jgi:hypothetical protein